MAKTSSFHPHEGRKLCLMRKWDAGEALRLVETERVTGWTAVPTMLQDMIQHPDFEKRDLSSLKSLGSGGAPTAPALVPKINRKFKSGAAGNGYGLTETNGAICAVNGADYAAHAASCGKPFPIVETMLVDDNGDEVEKGRGNRGELLIRSSLVMLEYWNKPEKTKEVLTPDGWFRTGDIAQIDDEEFIYIVDRKKDIVIRGGENISCSEVENAFYVNNDVLECTVVGVADERLGEDVAIMIYSKRPSSRRFADDLLATVQHRLATFKIPKPHNIFFTTTPLPKGATGKIFKQQVRLDVARMRKSKL
eukprot:m.1518618 g.1518618  ORF g.1518618 m.1518618 type:complete len:307 (+) comp25221_c3_seq11:3760-4680(+)